MILEYVERFGDAWVMLSARYGFVPPEFVIPGPYDTTFKRRSADLVTADTLCRQVAEHNLDAYSHVIGLGGQEYRMAITTAFHGRSVDLRFPFTGLGLGQAMQATQLALFLDNPYFRQ